MPTHLLHDPDQYITRMGHFLRKTSLDELPQLWNIFVGDMAVIGPRPALWNQYDLLAERDKYGANDVRPGLTGWAQIHGRDELEIAEKAKLDGWYVEHLSFIPGKAYNKTVHKTSKEDSCIMERTYINEAPEGHRRHGQGAGLYREPAQQQVYGLYRAEGYYRQTADHGGKGRSPRSGGYHRSSSPRIPSSPSPAR